MGSRCAFPSRPATDLELATIRRGELSNSHRSPCARSSLCSGAELESGGARPAHKTLFSPRSLLSLVIDYFKDDGLLISSFGEDETGEIYVAAYQSGRIYKIVAVDK